MQTYTPTSIPNDIAVRAAAQVAAGRFGSIGDVLRGGLDVLDIQKEADDEWLDYARREAAAGFAELDRGEGISGTAEEHMARIRKLATEMQGR